MRLLLTGGSGYVGRALIPRLLEDGHEVTALARSEAARRVVEGLGASGLPGSLTGDRPWLRALGAQEAVLHCAAPVEFWGPDRRFQEAIVEPTLALHDAAQAAGVRRFVYLSAAAVVHDGGPGRHDENDAVAPRKLSTGYARAKRTVELALADRPAEGMTRVVLRPPLIWGREMPTLDQFAAAAARPSWAWIDGGRAQFDALHVDNLVAALVPAVTQGRDMRPYFLTDEEPREFRAFLEALLATRGITPGKRSFPGWMARPNAAAMEAAFKAVGASSAPPLTKWIADFAGREHLYDDTPARQDLGYRPLVDFEDGVAGMISAAPRTEVAEAA